MNWRVDRIRDGPVAALVIAAAYAAVSLAFYRRLGLNLADEGFLWYGTIRTALGDVPMRDFQSYDPGRYYWGALWFKILRDDGIISLRVSLAAVQFLGLSLGLTVLHRRVFETWRGLAAAGLVIWAWMGTGPYESVILISAVYVAVLLIEQPSQLRHFLAGVFVGLAAFFGRNHGLYCALAFFPLILFIWLKTERRQLRVRTCLWLLGVVVGYLPMLAMIALIPGFLGAVIDTLTFNLTVATRLQLPVPWPWRPDYSALSWGESAFALGVGMLYVLLPIAYVAAGIHLLITRRGLERKAVLIAAVFVGVAYIDYTFSRASLVYLANTIQPALLGLIALPAAFDHRYRKVLTTGAWAFILIASRVTVWSGGWKAHAWPLEAVVHAKAVERYRGSYDLAYEEYGQARTEIRGEDVWLPFDEARLVRDVKATVQQRVAADEDILIAPYWTAFYPILRKKSPVWEIYFLLPQPRTRQEEMIRDLERKNVRWALLCDYWMDGRDELRFRNTHRYMWQYLMEQFERVDLDSLPVPCELRHRPARTAAPVAGTTRRGP